MDRMVLTCFVVRRRGAADRKKDLHGKSINVKACKDIICSVQLVGEEEVSKTNCDENWVLVVDRCRGENTGNGRAEFTLPYCRSGTPPRLLYSTLHLQMLVNPPRDGFQLQ